MLTVKIPLRVSLFGGGTDLPSFYRRNQYGSVISFSINKYIYISLKNHEDIFNEKFRFNYSKTEICNSISKIQNDIIRESIKFFNYKGKLYINTISDVPSSSGLGSSSSFAVGLVIAFNKFLGIKISSRKILEQAINLEVKILNKPIGLQDHYGCYYSGLKYLKFLNNNKVILKKIKINKKLNNILQSLQFFWTKIQRNSETVLKEQNNRYKINKENLLRIRSINETVFKKIKKNDYNINCIGKFLDESWNLKKKLSSNISNPFIDKAYNLAKINGALGGKILGAGNGGFIMILSKKKYHKKISNALSNMGLHETFFKINNKPITIIKN